MKQILLKIVRLSLFALVVLVTLGALLVAEENFRGKWAWEKYCSEKAAKGERLDFQGLIPPPVPDEQNFAMTPMVRSLFETPPESTGSLYAKFELTPKGPDKHLPSLGNWTRGQKVDLEDWKRYFEGKEVLTALEEYDGELREISAAVRRPYCRFPFQYEKGFALALPICNPFSALGKLYRLRACAELRQGQTEAATADLETLIGLANCTKAEPLLILVLVRNVQCISEVQVLWEGLADHRWSEPQLASIQGALAGQDLLTHLHLALRGERAGVNASLLQAVANPKILSSMMGPSDRPQHLEYLPRGMIYQNLLTYNRLCDEMLLPADSASFRTFAERYREEGTRLVLSSYLSILGVPVPNPKTVLVANIFPALEHIFERTLYTQVSLDEAVTACALERYWLANGRYPDSLGDLVPRYLSAVPRDAASGGELIYKPGVGGNFLLYSVGWNGVDEGGKPAFSSSHSQEITKGDWVW